MDRRRLVAGGALVMVIGIVLAVMGYLQSSSAEPAVSPLSPVAGEGFTSPATAGASTPSVTSPRATPSSATSPAWSASGPVTLAIPSIKLSARAQGRGLDSRGVINPPPGEVMWFTGYDRVRPGRPGVAVVAAHVVWGGEPDVFHRLSEVAKGQKVTIRDPKTAQNTTFVVTKVKVVDKYELTKDQDVWGAPPKEPTLAIITCDSSLGMRADGHRVANYVVIAKAA